MNARVTKALAAALTAILAAAAGARSGWCVTYYFATDVPANLAGIDYTPATIVRSDAGTYALEAALPAGTVLAALDRRPNGRWLIVPAHVQMLGAVNARPRDVLEYDGSAFTLVLDGGAAGIPAYARLDALLTDPAGDLVFSFDAPVNLAGTEYRPSDLVRLHAGAFTLFWDSAAAGVLLAVNVVGAARDADGTLVLTFDAPSNLGGTDYLPGQLVAWSGGVFSSYVVDPAWPRSAQLRDFAFPPGAGAVPDGAAVAGVPLGVALSGGTLTLSWGASCGTGDSDYEIYEGTLGAFYSHTQKSCTTGGALTASFPAPAGDAYYLVVPRNAVREGSYGKNSSGTERPQGAAACLPREIITPCP